MKKKSHLEASTDENNQENPNIIFVGMRRKEEK